MPHCLYKHIDLKCDLRGHCGLIVPLRLSFLAHNFGSLQRLGSQGAWVLYLGMRLYNNLGSLQKPGYVSGGTRLTTLVEGD